MKADGMWTTCGYIHIHVHFQMEQELVSIFDINGYECGLDSV